MEPKREPQREGGGLHAGLSPSEGSRVNLRRRLCELLDSAQGGAAERCAVGVEDALYCLFHGEVRGGAYKAQLRLVVAGLKDPKNVALREGLLSGRTPPAALATMQAAEFRNPEQCAAEEVIRAEMTADMAAVARPMQETSMYRCGRCRKSRCSFYEMQTRSGDEPMTQFITCLHCNNRWKM